MATRWARMAADTRFRACRQKRASGLKIAFEMVWRLGIDMEGSLLRLKSFIPPLKKLPFEYGQISMFDYATFQKYPLDLATGTLNGISQQNERYKGT